MSLYLSVLTACTMKSTPALQMALMVISLGEFLSGTSSLLLVRLLVQSLWLTKAIWSVAEQLCPSHTLQKAGRSSQIWFYLQLGKARVEKCFCSKYTESKDK